MEVISVVTWSAVVADRFPLPLDPREGVPSPPLFFLLRTVAFNAHFALVFNPAPAPFNGLHVVAV